MAAAPYQLPLSSFSQTVRRTRRGVGTTKLSNISSFWVQADKGGPHKTWSMNLSFVLTCWRNHRGQDHEAVHPHLDLHPEPTGVRRRRRMTEAKSCLLLCQGEQEVARSCRARWHTATHFYWSFSNTSAQLPFMWNDSTNTTVSMILAA